MKNLTIAGRITKDAELRRTQSGDPVLSFSVAVDDGYGQNKSTLFFDASLFGKRGEAIAHLLMKGQPVTVSGDLSKREHNGKTYLTIRVADVTLQGKPQGGSQGGRNDYDSGKSSSGSQQSSRSDYDSEIPF